MSRDQRRRRYQLASMGCWIVALALWILRFTGTHSVALDAVVLVATAGAFVLTIAAARNS